MSDEFRDTQQDQFRAADDLFAPVPATSGIWETGVGFDVIIVRVSLSVEESAGGIEIVGDGSNLALVEDSGAGADYITSSGSDKFSITNDDVFVATTDDLFAPGVLSGFRVIDSGTAEDQVSVLNLTSIEITENSTGVDTPFVMTSILLPDTATGYDGIPVPGIRVVIQLSESAVGQDTTSAGAPDTYVIGDGGVSSDEVTAAILSSVLDSGAAAEEIIRNKGIPINDTGSGADTISVLVSVVVEDSSQEIFEWNLIPGINYAFIQDSATSDDAVVTSPLLTISDSGSGQDVILDRSSLISIIEEALAEEIIGGYSPSGVVRRIEIIFSSARVDIVFI